MKHSSKQYNSILIRLLCLLLLIAVQIIAIVQIIAVQIIAMGLEIIKKNGWNQKLKIAPIWMKLCAHTTECSSLWEKSWSGGLKMANKGKPKFPTFSKKS